MGQPLRATALIVEDDPMQRDMICLLLEESEVDVIECESAEAAELVLQRAAGSLVLMLTDVQLAGIWTASSSRTSPGSTIPRWA